ncbi:MAG: MarR family transcriptional regulator [Sphaerotilus natans]
MNDRSDAAPVPPIYDSSTYRPERSLGLLMRRVLGSVLQEADRRLAEHDLTHAQWMPLFKLLKCCAGDSVTVASLARDLDVDPAAVTRMLDRLEVKGLVRRERSTSDRRVVQLVLTEAGREVAEKVPPVLVDVLNAHLAGFRPEEFEMLMSLLQRMLANGEAMRARAGGDPA